MKMLLPARILPALLLLGCLRAEGPGGATVAFITNNEGPHLSAYIPALAAAGEATSVVMADSSGQVIPAARRALGARLTATYATTQELFAHQRPVLTVIALEPRLAVPAIEAALDAGSHVMAEKPACLGIAEFERLARKADSRKLLLMLALANRLNPDIRFARQLVTDGKIGRIYGIEVHLIADQTRLTKAEYRNSWFSQKARAGGGHLIWLGIHWIDLAMFLTGSDVSEVAGFTANVGGQPIDVEDSAVLSLKFANGTLGTLTSGYYVDKGYHSHIKIWGSKGWIEINPHGTDNPFMYYSTAGAKPVSGTFTPREGPVGYTPFIAACVRAALGRGEPPLTTADSLRAIRTIYTAYHAVETGRVQAVLH